MALFSVAFMDSVGGEGHALALVSLEDTDIVATCREGECRGGMVAMDGDGLMRNFLYFRSIKAHAPGEINVLTQTGSEIPFVEAVDSKQFPAVNSEITSQKVAGLFLQDTFAVDYGETDYPRRVAVGRK